MKKLKTFKISVIIQVVNKEKFLKDSIDSIINQTIEFKDNIQLIILDKMNPVKNTEEISKGYIDKYPENIIYKKIDSNKINFIRNEGLKLVTGKYVIFLNLDEIWNKDSFEKMYDFLEKNYDEIDFVAARRKYIGKKEEYYYLDYKFKDNEKIVDINEDYEYIQTELSGLLKTEIAKKYTFNEDLIYEDEIEYLVKVLFEKEKYGLLNSAIVNIRKPNNKISIFNKSFIDDNIYIKDLEKTYKNIIEFSNKKYGSIKKYIQFLILDELSVRYIKELAKRF